jgi:hypothetical protein
VPVELPIAIDLYRAMDMIFWLPQAEVTLALNRGGELTGKGLMEEESHGAHHTRTTPGILCR